MNGSQALEVRCRSAGDGWDCDVTVGQGAGATRHEVHVEHAVLERLDPGAPNPEQLVRGSFEFMLEREPRESILHSFELPVIGRYFPEWEDEMGKRRAAR